MGRRKAQPVSGNTGKPFDEPMTQKTPALRVAFWTGARGVAALDRIADTLFARLLADRLARTQRSGYNLVQTCSYEARRPLQGRAGT